MCVFPVMILYFYGTLSGTRTTTKHKHSLGRLATDILFNAGVVYCDEYLDFLDYQHFF